MPFADDPPSGATSSEPVNAARLAALEEQVAALRAEMASIRRALERGAVQSTANEALTPEPAARRQSPWVDASLAEALRRPPRGPSEPTARRGASPFTRATAAAGAAIHGAELESLVGRYGTLLLAALVILMGVGVLIRVAVTRGLLTPEVRVGIGALAAAAVAAAGLFFRRRRELRYGNVLLALALAVVDLVAWGAGPRFHLVPIGAALVAVDIASIALAALALSDRSEFLFCVAVGGALSAPFVTSDVGGTAPTLLGYGAAVLIGGMRAVRDPSWWRLFGLLVAGSLVYALSAAALPSGIAWYSPFIVVLFGGGCALAALVVGPDAWRGKLARALLAVAVVGVPAGWDLIAVATPKIAPIVAVALAAITYAALHVRTPKQPYWRESAVLLPLLSLGIAMASSHGGRFYEAGVFAAWAAFALAAWRAEVQRGDGWRGGAHLLAGGLLAGAAVATWLWPTPLFLVAGLSAWGVALAWLVRSEETTLPLWSVGASLGAAALSAMDQLASRADYSYVPFVTRSSASAACAAAGLAVGGAVLGSGEGAPSRWADRPVRLAVLIGFLVLWGRMEVAGAFTPDLATFLLIAYYAACGLASIIVGRRLSITRLRVAGLGLAIYAAVKAVVEASEISGVLLRVGAYGAVGVFLLGAGYLYRERGAAQFQPSPVDTR
jgi:uncharacterized membrane protein